MEVFNKQTCVGSFAALTALVVFVVHVHDESYMRSRVVMRNLFYCRWHRL